MGGGGADSLKGDDNGDLPHPDTQETITYTFKTYNDYFTDLNITKQTITNDDLTGSGTKSDPYVVHSTKGFLYITNHTIAGSIANKYLELACDVILNDETFDEEGNPSGGDGTYYNYQERQVDGNGLFFNGNGYTISGLYCKGSTELSRSSLFYNVTLNEVSYLNMDNFYVEANMYVSAVASSIKNCSNVVLQSGVVKGNNQVGGISGVIQEKATNCKNYATIIGAGENTGGLFKTASNNAYIEKCINYGKIFAAQSGGGIVGGAYNAAVTFVQCENYGDITRVGNNLHGGIIASAYKTVRIIGCKNYGKIINGASGSAGLVGYVNGNLILEDSGNYVGWEGVDSSYKGSFIGAVVGSNIVISIKNCVSNSNRSLIGRLESGKTNIVINIDGLKFDEDLSITRYALVHSDDSKSTEINVKNLYLNVTLKTANAKVYLFNTLKNTTTCKIKNAILNVSSVYVFSFRNYLINPSNHDTQVDGFLVNYVEQGIAKNFYIGSNFSGFYVSWRTGKIGLIALDGRGQFQGAVDEEWLLGKGYEKKTI